MSVFASGSCRKLANVSWVYNNRQWLLRDCKQRYIGDETRVVYYIINSVVARGVWACREVHTIFYENT